MPFVPLKPEELRVGLYVKLECSWWNHPFAKNKFKVTSQKEINTIKGIKKLQLFYDPELSDSSPEESTPDDSLDISKSQSTGPTQEDLQREQEEIRQEQIQACSEHTTELQKASYLYQQVLAQTKIAMKRISDGHSAGIKSVEQVLSTLLHSLGDSGKSMAIIDILSSYETDDPFITHALNVCIVSILVGKEFQLEEDELYALGLAGLLHDIGKQNFPTMLRMKRTGLARNEQQEWVKHSEMGKTAVARFSAIPESTVQAILQHHERLDGSGFPLGLVGDDISLFAKIVMVADEYDHLCHQSDHAKSLTPAEALSYLYDHYVVDKLMSLSDTINAMLDAGDDGANSVVHGQENGVGQVANQSELSEEVIAFMVRALGVYPPGSLVELTNGSVGLVTSINSTERTKPSVMICSPEIPRKEARVIDLTKVDDISVVHSIRPQHLPKEIQEYIFSGRSA